MQIRQFGFRRRELGASAVEFALVFPSLLAIFYGIFVYGYIFLLFQSVNFAAQEGARAAVQVPPASDDGMRLSLAQAAAGSGGTGVMSFLPAAQKGLVSVTGVGLSTGPQLQYQVTVTMRTVGIFPRIPLPLIGDFPALPDNLTGVAVGLKS